MTAQPHGAIPEFTQGDRLRKARELTGLTAQEFADEIGVSRGTITNAETDARQVRSITMRAYALRTGVPLTWLETGEAPVQPEPDGGRELDSTQEASDEPQRWPLALVPALRAA